MRMEMLGKPHPVQDRIGSETLFASLGIILDPLLGAGRLLEPDREVGTREMTTDS